EDTASALAQGGIAAALGEGDSVEAHVRDTLTAGASCNEPEPVRTLAAGAADAVAWLETQGVAFDRDADGLLLGREGGHGAARVVHAGGDATGAGVMAALSAAALRAPHIHWRGGVDVDALRLRAGRVAGVRWRHCGGDDGHDSEWVDTDTVVLATGGIGALFERTTNPAGADGAALALALAAGAQPRDLEFIQFHPTALDVRAGSLPLVTEALRGAGARLLDVAGRPLMDGVHPLGDLAPRDVVARQVWQARNEGGLVRLDARRLGICWQCEFPTVLAACIAHGIDPRVSPIPVTPAAHFHMGGLAVDDLGRTTLAGLHAVGEAACSGVHGANRLASNSLLEGVVFGRRLGAHLASSGAADAGDAGAGETLQIERGPGLGADGLRELRALMWHAAGPVRSTGRLQEAVARTTVMGEAGWQARLANAILLAALQRRTSVGAHWRKEAAVSPAASGGADINTAAH
ncbi:MAG TPA: FAD-binding protein, partial [Lysobacter sp.]|nr:FAD-binding protein [Lysobacter sp.]